MPNPAQVPSLISADGEAFHSHATNSQATNSQPINSEAFREGWWQSALAMPSPNFNQRPDDIPVRLIVLHNISLPPGEFGSGAVVRFFQNQLDPQEHPYFREIESLQVSAHFFIERDGRVIQCVSCDQRAWHAGRSSYLGVADCNDYSIGIELEGTDTVPFTDAQYTSLQHLVSAIQAHYPDTSHQLTGHSDIAPGRKTDPGSCFDWLRFRRHLKG